MKHFIFALCIAALSFSIGYNYDLIRNDDGGCFADAEDLEFPLLPDEYNNKSGLEILNQSSEYFISNKRYDEAACLSFLQAAIVGNYVEEMAEAMMIMSNIMLYKMEPDVNDNDDPPTEPDVNDNDDPPLDLQRDYKFNTSNTQKKLESIGLNF
jgi:hypothetical protein